MVTKLTKLTDAQRGQMDAWADRWIEVGLRTGPADRERFEDAARRCYEYAGIPWPGVVVWVPSPLVLVLAAPIAMHLLRHLPAADGAVGGVVDDAVSGAVSDAVSGAVSDAVSGAVSRAVGGVVDDAVSRAVGGVVDDAVSRVVGRAVDGAVSRVVGRAVDGAVSGAVGADWFRYMGGQFWVGNLYWGPASVSFYRDVCGLELPGDLWDRARAYQATAESACWWYPTTDFVMVCERPTVIHREMVDPERPRGWGSHRLHCDDGPAVAWPDGWGVWAIHGTLVPRHVVEAPETITAAEITANPNAEVRRVMLERFGAARYIQESGAREIDRDRDMYGAARVLYRVEMPGDEDLVMVHVINSTPEPDGSYHEYWLRVDPRCQTAREAIASTCRWPDGSRVFAFNEEPVIAS